MFLNHIVSSRDNFQSYSRSIFFRTSFGFTQFLFFFFFLAARNNLKAFQYFILTLHMKKVSPSSQDPTNVFEQPVSALK